MSYALVQDAFEAKNETDLKATIEHKPGFAHTRITLASDDSQCVGDAGAMLWMDGSVSMEAGCHSGGPCRAYWRTCAREQCCQVKFTGPGDVVFGDDLPGDMLPFMCEDKEGGDWIVTKGSFFCGTSNLIVSAKWKGCQAWLCSGEGGMLTHIRSEGGSGVFFAGGYGMVERQKVPDGKTLYLNTGLFFAAQASTPFEITLPGGCVSCFCSGEDFVMKFVGPVVVYTQNRNPEIIRKLLQPVPANGGGGEGGDGGGGS